MVVVIRNENNETEVVTDDPRILAHRRTPLPSIRAASPAPLSPVHPVAPHLVARNQGTPTLKLAKSPLPKIPAADQTTPTSPLLTSDLAPPSEPKPAASTSGKHVVVYRTKQQRQVPSVDHVTRKYEMGRKLGDGNFAVVKQATMISNRIEYAMKIMDKVCID